MTQAAKRIAILGFDIESHRYAPVSTREDFEDCCLAFTDDVLEASMLKPLLDRDGQGFGGVMTSLYNWEAVPILFGTAGAGGPCDANFFEEMKQKTTDWLRAAGDLDGVFIVGHGAGITTDSDDLDGDYYETVRRAVGPNVPIIATLDLHGNVTPKMVDSTDILIAFLTNPHVDMAERSAEAARLMDEMFRGMKPTTSFIRVPLMTPQVTQLTAEGQPYGDLIRFGQTHIDETVANVSLLSGFAFNDTQHNGMSVLVTTRNDPMAADALAQKLADRTWAERARYVPQLVSVDEATHKAADTSRTRPIILADVADNPGGGARGNTTWILESLYKAGIKGVQVGIFYDPGLVKEARKVGEGKKFSAHFNRDEASEFSRPFTADATVVRLTDGNFRGLRGTIKDTDVRLGLSCLLDLGGILVAVISIRQQIFSSETLEHFGLNPLEANVIVVKSRGHFRAGFDHFVSAEDTFEVDAPGLTTPNLKQATWENIIRPIYPLDKDMVWNVPTPYRSKKTGRSEKTGA